AGPITNSAITGSVVGFAKITQFDSNYVLKKYPVGSYEHNLAKLHLKIADRLIKMGVFAGGAVGNAIEMGQLGYHLYNGNYYEAGGALSGALAGAAIGLYYGKHGGVKGAAVGI